MLRSSCCLDTSRSTLNINPFETPSVAAALCGFMPQVSRPWQTCRSSRNMRPVVTRLSLRQLIHGTEVWISCNGATFLSDTVHTKAVRSRPPLHAAAAVCCVCYDFTLATMWQLRRLVKRSPCCCDKLFKSESFSLVAANLVVLF